MRRTRIALGLSLALLALAQAWIVPGALEVRAAPSKDVASDPTTGRVDINTADEAELQKIPGVGESLARRILEFRKRHGRFERVEDLMKVRGIGEKSLEKMRPHVTVGQGK